MNIHQHRLGDTQLLESSFAEKDLGGQQIETEFLVRSRVRMRDNRHKLKYNKQHLNIVKFFTGSVVEPWHRLSREVVESPTLEILKTHVDTAPG